MTELGSTLDPLFSPVMKKRALDRGGEKKREKKKKKNARCFSPRFDRTVERDQQRDFHRYRNKPTITYLSRGRYLCRVASWRLIALITEDNYWATECYACCRVWISHGAQLLACHVLPSQRSADPIGKINTRTFISEVSAFEMVCTR